MQAFEELRAACGETGIKVNLFRPREWLPAIALSFTIRTPTGTKTTYHYPERRETIESLCNRMMRD
jgi:hypothetical protein